MDKFRGWLLPKSLSAISMSALATVHASGERLIEVSASFHRIGDAKFSTSSSFLSCTSRLWSFTTSFSHLFFKLSVLTGDVGGVWRRENAKRRLGDCKTSQSIFLGVMLPRIDRWVLGSKVLRGDLGTGEVGRWRLCVDKFFAGENDEKFDVDVALKRFSCSSCVAKPRFVLSRLEGCIRSSS